MLIIREISKIMEEDRVEREVGVLFSIKKRVTFNLLEWGFALKSKLVAAAVVVVVKQWIES